MEGTESLCDEDTSPPAHAGQACRVCRWGESLVIQQEGWAVYSPSLCEGGSSRFSLCGNKVHSAKGREESDLSSIVKEKSMGRQLIWGPLG